MRISDWSSDVCSSDLFKNCLFGDVMLYQKSLTNLAKAPDLWAAVGPGSEARSQQWLERQGDGTVNSFIITCRQAYQALDAQWGPMIEANAPLWGKEVYPKLSNALARSEEHTSELQSLMRISYSSLFL